MSIKTPSGTRSALTRACPRNRVRPFATLQLPSPAPYLPSFPTPIATSSSWTLDHPLWSLPKKYSNPTPKNKNIIAALVFASDDDLIHAILSNPSPPSSRTDTHQHGADDWSASIDPGLAFLALRSRPLYASFLAGLYPHLKTVYTRLRISGSHQLLVSDLLLRHPDPRILRNLLELGCTEPSPIRGSLASSIYTLLRSSSVQLQPLPLRTNIYLSKILPVETLPPIWDDLFQVLPTDPESTWNLLAITQKIVKVNPQTALIQLRSLFESERLPSTLLSDIDPSHASFAEIIVLTTSLRFALLWKLDVRGYGICDKLVSIIEEEGTEEVSQGVWDVVSECTRTWIASKDPQLIERAGKLLEKLSGWRNIPTPIPGSTIESYLAICPNSQRSGWYIALHSEGHQPITPSVLLSLVLHEDTPDSVWDRVLSDLSRSDIQNAEGIHAQFLKVMGSTHRQDQLEQLYNQWKPRMDISTGLNIIDSVIMTKPILVKRILADLEDQHTNMLVFDRIEFIKRCIVARDLSRARRNLSMIDHRATGLQQMLKGILDYPPIKTVPKLRMNTRTMLAGLGFKDVL